MPALRSVLEAVDAMVKDLGVDYFRGLQESIDRALRSPEMVAIARRRMLRVLNARADKLCRWRHACTPSYDCACEWEAEEAYLKRFKRKMDATMDGHPRGQCDNYTECGCWPEEMGGE